MSMLPYTSAGSGSLTLVMMPFLGGTQAEWSEVIDLLSANFRCVTVDLPGFGAAAEVAGYTVDAMAGHVIDTLRVLNSDQQMDKYVLIGHSMAGKVSAVVARRLLEVGDANSRPEALILVSPSPPAPEPMTDKKRAEMLSMFGASDRSGDFVAADRFIAENTAMPLPEEKLKRTANGVLEMNRDAWVAWLEHGSKEDWSEYVGVIDLPVLIVAGGADGSLGPSAQRESTLPHFSSAELVELQCSHLAPLERPNELAKAMRTFLAGIAA